MVMAAAVANAVNALWYLTGHVYDRVIVKRQSLLFTGMKERNK